MPELKPFKNVDFSLPSNHFVAQGIEFIITAPRGDHYKAMYGIDDVVNIETKKRVVFRRDKLCEVLEKNEAIFLESLVGY